MKLSESTYEVSEIIPQNKLKHEQHILLINKPLALKSVTSFFYLFSLLKFTAETTGISCKFMGLILEGEHSQKLPFQNYYFYIRRPKYVYIQFRIDMCFEYEISRLY